MNIKRASKSAIETYESCAWMYYLQYPCGIRTPSGKSAVLGTICHKVLEFMALRKKHNKHTKVSKLNDWEFLLKIAFEHEKRINSHITFENKDYNFCKTQLLKIINSNDNPFKLNVLDVEKGFNLEFNIRGFKYNHINHKNEAESGNFVLNGFMDIVIESEKDGEKVLNIRDYKFGKYATDWATGEEKSDFSKDLQVRCYYLAAKRLYPQYKRIFLTVIYVQLNKSFEVELKDIDEVKAIDVLRRHYNQILLDNNPKRLIDDSTKKNMQFKCKSVCHFGKTLTDDGEVLCDYYHRMYLKNGYNNTINKIQELTLNGKKVSRKMDYSHIRMKNEE